MLHADTGKPWTPADDAALVDELGRGRAVDMIAASLQRSAADVRARLDALAAASAGARADPLNIFPKDIAAS